MQADDLRLLGIPRLRLKITRIDPYHDTFEDYPDRSTKVINSLIASV